MIPTFTPVIEPYQTAGAIRRNLRTIRDHYDNALHPKAGAASEIRTVASGEPVSLHALDVQNECHRGLVFWIKFILNKVNDGTITGDTIRGRSIDDLAKFIDTWALALAEQLPDDADNLDAETRRHANRLQELALGWVTRQIHVGHCPAQVLADGSEQATPCAGTLIATLQERDNGLLPQAIRCDADPTHEWSPGEWPALGRQLGTFVA